MTKSHDEIRILIAQNTAKLIYDEGLDITRARRKAGKRFGAELSLAHGHYLPRANEIYQQLKFLMASCDAVILNQRRNRLIALAIDALDFFKPFSPYLIGDVVDTPYSRVTMRLYADHPDDVEDYLYNHDILFETSEQVPHSHHDRLLVSQDDGIVECMILPRSKQHQLIKSTMTGKMIPRLSIQQLLTLCDRASCTEML